MNLINIGIVDDHKAVLQAFKAGLTRDLEIKVVLEAENGHDLFQKLLKCRPDIILLDLKMPGLNGTESSQLLFEKYPEIKVLILSAFIDETYIAQCLQFGIYGYLSKTMDLSEIIIAIKKVNNNERYFDNLIANQLLKNYLNKFHKNINNILPEFSNKEIEILTLLKDEKTTEEISDLLHLSKRSIELKRDNMKVKANRRTVAGLLLYAMQRGLIE